jgi:hypothetical protein
VRLNGTNLVHVAPNRSLDVLGDLVCAVELEIARELQVERDFERSVKVKHRQVVDLADVRDGECGRENTLANSAIATTRLDVHDGVDSRERIVECLLDPIGGRVALADRGSRRDADDDIGEVLATGPAQSEPAELDGRVERRNCEPSDTCVLVG